MKQTLRRDLKDTGFFSLEKRLRGEKFLGLSAPLSIGFFIGWRLNHFPGQPVPMLDNPFSEEKFPNIQSKPPLAQLEAISFRPITCYLGEETDPQPPFSEMPASLPWWDWHTEQSDVYPDVTSELAKCVDGTGPLTSCIWKVQWHEKLNRFECRWVG
ncbi:hypothetical protein QYF61_026781 [Mycteria americana]|uniref:Uncharacterized protein n=1 Tax=Mycteria americana TaxID=33587 RepID=A0AAN7NM59_MYCAM|nr:hypothetical protein QYF61_026781 [Mycteria americana]